MEDPEREISMAINLCAGAPSADIQIDSFHYYMVDDHSFLHPLCFVPHGRSSLRKVVGIFIFYRSIVWKTRFTINTCAFDRRTNNLYVDLVQEPHLRFFPFFVPKVPMHCHFHLRQIGLKYYIDYHEDILQPKEVLNAIPVLSAIGNAWFLLCEYVGLLLAYACMLLGWWKPEEHLRAKGLLGVADRSVDGAR